MISAVILAALVSHPTLAFVGEPTNDWIAVRLEDLATHASRNLGFDVADRIVRKVDPSIADACVTVRFRTTSQTDGKKSPTLHVEVSLGGLAKSGRSSVFKGGIEELDSIGLELAKIAWHAAKTDFTEPSWLSLLRREDPSDLHKKLADAAIAFEARDARAAALAFDRVSSLRSPPVDAEAIQGAIRARSNTQDATGYDAELAASAFDRASREASIASKISALLSALRYTPNRSRNWATALPIPLGSKLFLGQDVLLLDRPGASPIWFDAWNGFPIEAGAPTPNIVAVAGQKNTRHVVTLSENKIRRGPIGGAAIHEASIPFSSASATLSPIRGQLLLSGAHASAWFDLALGSLQKPLPDIVPLAAGTDASVVMTGSELGLLRAGQRALAWKTAVPARPRVAALVFDRVVTLDTEGVTIHDALDGRIKSKLPACPEARLFPTEGRFAALELCDQIVEVIDVLGAERIARIVPPGKMVGAASGRNGIALVFDSGDILGIDREGKLSERQWLPGTPLQVAPSALPGRGPTVLTRSGLWSLGDLGGDGLTEADVWLALVDIALSTKEYPLALQLFSVARNEVGSKLSELHDFAARAFEGLGRPQEAEAMRVIARKARESSTPLGATGMVGPGHGG